jgi:peptidyl-prolyl cis-trans isomerase C
MNLTTLSTKRLYLTFVQRCFREPLLYFLLIGFGLFWLYNGLNSSPATPIPQRIEITPQDIQRIEISWLARWQRPPTDQQLHGMLDEFVKEEILYREALKLGLDKNDTIVRRRLAQKMDFLAEDIATLREPKPGELEEWYVQHQDQYAPPALATFRHLFFASDKRGSATQAQAQAALANPTGPDTAQSDAFIFESSYTEQTHDQVARTFGSKFAIALFQQAPGKWVGPLESGFGWHLVWIDALATPPAPPFETVAQLVKSDWLSAQRSESKRLNFETLKTNYEVVVMMPPPTDGIASPQSELR